MKLYLSLDSSRCFALPDDQALPPGDTVVRRLMHPPERSDLDALSQWEIPREEGLELAKTLLDGSAMAKFEAQILELQADLRKPETQAGLRKVAEGLKKLGQDARARRLAREAREKDG
jgi:hypothetical protein